MMLIAIVAVVLALVVAVALLARQQRASVRWPSDAEGLEEMRRRGVDLSKPCAFEFHLHFSSREVAVDAERAIVGEGYEAKVSGGPGLPVAIVCVKKSLVPTEAELLAVRMQLVALSRRYGGSYQGWFGSGQPGGSGV